MAIDRNKFKASSVTKMADDDAALNNSLGKGAGRAGMLKVTVGKNKFRIYPAHPEDNLPEDKQPGFSQPFVKTFLPMMVVERDEKGNEVIEKGKQKMRESAKPVFNSRIHGNTPKDLVEEYIKLARVVADNEFDDKAEKQEYLDNIYGKFSKIAAERKMGIGYKTAHVMYADKITGDAKEFGRIEIKDSVKNRMNTIAASEAEGEAMGVDPFTDLDDGRCIVINYDDKATQAANYYTTTLDTDIDKVSKMAKFYPITDDMLEEFAKQPTLRSMYVNVFKRKDFELQVQGLEYFDAKNNMGICEKPEWEKIYAEIDSYYSDDDAVEAPIQEDDSEPDEDQFADMSRNQLKLYISTNKLGILIRPAHDEEQIREMIREAIADVTDAEPEAVQEWEAEPEAVEEKPKRTALAGLRKKS